MSEYPVGKAGAIARPQVILAIGELELREPLCECLAPECDLSTIWPGEAAVSAAADNQPCVLVAASTLDDGSRQWLSDLKNHPSAKAISVVLALPTDGKQKIGDSEPDGFLVQPLFEPAVLATVRSCYELATLRGEQVSQKAERHWIIGPFPRIVHCSRR